ncbi:uncharacterized protein N0V89_004475 [Didymosphaeria variabile]|uniref:Beta-lactamase/transpeptidase-like protein n=1 Tax=Didymosphaeria variabile TaxID=1932322 RepID=A0A9W9CDG4_9PLEO|nr:uncharacterized protein N0V89_004475 [Didymosphaeria variabile]KAJ4356442.1 hypothetical protein N0V89_004475 [Didymosphaeria variabile]
MGSVQRPITRPGGFRNLPNIETLTSRLKNVQPIIEQICNTMGQVGLSYGVLYQGQVVLARGYGDRDHENQKPADENTLFNIASCTKAFTATACALLAQEGSLDLNLPVKEYLPELKEEQATLVDLLAHRTGYARLDTSWVGQRSEVLVSHAELIKRVNALPKLRSLGSEWLYNNWMYAVAGVVVERHNKGHLTYMDFVKKCLLEAYCLTRSCIERKDIPDDNISLAYVASRSRTALPIPEPPWEESPFTPGGGIRSCVVDMLKWSELLLAAYAADAKDASSELRSPVSKHPGVIFSPKMILPDAVSYGQLERSYGMGFLRFMLPSKLSHGGRNATVASEVAIPPVGNNDDHTLALAHAGENAGALSAFTLFPELDTAVIVLGNTTALGDTNELVMHLLSSQIMTSELQVDYTALATSIAEQCKSWHERTISKPLSKHRVQGTNAGSLEEYVGEYEGFEYSMKVSLESDGLILHHGGRASQRARLTHYHYDTFSFATSDYEEHLQLGMIDYDDWRLLLLHFERDYSGAIVGIKWFLDGDISPVLLGRKA